jgi:hypothetical protein
VTPEREVTPATLEQFLETRFGATGNAVSEKIASVESRLPAPLVTQLRAVFATARQLETGGTVDVSSYRRLLLSSAEQLELLAAPLNPKPEPNAPQPVTPPPPTKVPRIGTTASPRAPKVSRLKVWLYDTRQRIPARAHRLSRTWRIPGSGLGGLIGAVAGWFVAGIGGAIAGGIALGVVVAFSLSESALARGLWAQTRAVEGLFALLRLLGRATLAVLAIVVVGLIVFFVTRFWNVR